METSNTDLRQRSATSREFWSGVRNQLPILVGVLPAGLIFGALGKQAGFASPVVLGFSFFVFAGSAQFVALGLAVIGAPPLVIILAIFVVNLRHALYSATFSEHLARLPARWKIPLAWLLTDEAFAVASVRFAKPDRQRAHWYLLGTGLALWVTWQLSTAVGIVLGAGVPDSWHLDFALPLTFLALLTPTITDGPTRLAALASAVLAVGLGGLPYRAGLLVAVMIAVGLGVWSENHSTARRKGI
jgi:4-azaleucine resistance transporter AzlC